MHATAQSKDLCIFFFLQLRKPTFRQIFPSRIHADDQLNLLDPGPTLQLSFPGNRVMRSLKLFPVHQPVHLVTAGKSLEEAGLMLENALYEFAGGAYVERLGTVAHDVNVIPSLKIHRSFDCALTLARAPLRMTTLLNFHNLQTLNPAIINQLDRKMNRGNRQMKAFSALSGTPAVRLAKVFAQANSIPLEKSRLENRLIVPNQHFLRGPELFDIRELNLLAMHTVIFNTIIELFLDPLANLNFVIRGHSQIAQVE